MPARLLLRSVAGVFVAVLAVGVLPLFGAAAPAAAGVAPGAPVVLVGVAGLRWSDVDAKATPHLWAAARSAALGSMTVRATASWTCPGDGWLTLGSGRRAQFPRPEVAEPPAGVARATCPALPTPRRQAGSLAAQVPNWPAVLESNAALNYDAHPGLLGATLDAAGRCATAVGPGAALALADERGRVPTYLSSVPQLTTAAAQRCPVLVVDLGVVADPGFDSVTVAPSAEPAQTEAGAALASREGLRLAADVPPRADQVGAVDARLADLGNRLPAGATLLLTTVADSARESHLGLALARGGGFGDGWLLTRSTRRTALVQLTDVLPTVLTAARVVVPADAIGAPWTATAARPPVPRAVRELQDRDTAAVVSKTLLGPFTIFLVLSQLLLYSAAAVALARRWGGGDARHRVLRATRAAALVFAALPIASYLANLSPWWRRDHPLASLLASLGLAAAALAVFALVGPWRRHLLGPPTAIAVVTALVLTVDVARGSPLQLNAVLGYSPLVAGRFFGFGNIAFALFAASTVMATAGLASALVERGRRRAAGGLAAVAGLAAVVVDGYDRLGTDFGGVLALVPGFAVLGMGLAGARTTARRLLLSLVGGVVAISALAYADWRQPPERRTHLGRFVQQVIDGQAATVVGRKLDANLNLLFHTPFGLIVPAAVAFFVFVLMRPLRWRAAALQLAYSRAPALRPGLFGAVTALVVGFAVNDSGIVIPAVGLAIVVPLALAASVTALEREDDELGVPDERDDRDGSPNPRPAPRGPARTTA